MGLGEGEGQGAGSARGPDLDRRDPLDINDHLKVSIFMPCNSLNLISHYNKSNYTTMIALI